MSTELRPHELTEIAETTRALSPFLVPWLMAFSRAIRKEIGEKYNWTCVGDGQGNPCIWESIQGKPASYQDGFWVQASHKNHKRGQDYNDPEGGMIQCTVDHYMYERSIGKYSHADLIADRSDIYIWDALDNPDNYPELDFRVATVHDVIRKYREVKLEEKVEA